MKKKYLFLSAAVLVLLVSGAGTYWYFVLDNNGQNNQLNSPQPAPTPSPEPPATAPSSPEPAPTPPAAAPVFDTKKYSIDDPASIWVIVNKKRPLPSGYTPKLVSANGAQLRSEASGQLGQLLNAAKSAGAAMSVLSSYRSYATQTSTYNGWVAKDGQAAADTYSARAGYSEHQTGLAADLGNGTCNLETCFANTSAGKWLAANAYKYGFLIRYPETKQAITGYQYEPWHIRYVGTELAAEIQKTGKTMEEFFGLPAAPNY